MREDDSNWFSRWEEQLPPPEELMPLSQTLITPDLAIAFDIRNPLHNHNQPSNPHPQPPPPPSSLPSSTDFADSAELGSGTAGEEPARTLKRPRLVWTPQLHKRFVDAVAHLGIKNAVPKTIMQLMSVDGLTRENVASHLQKYRLYLKRMQGISAGGGSGGGSGPTSVADAATDHLFASCTPPPHFLHPAARPNSEHFLPFVPVPAIHHHQQLAAAAAAAQYHRPVGFGSPPNGHHFENPFLSRQQQQQQQHQHQHQHQQHQQQLHRMGAQLHNNPLGGAYVEDMESANASGGRKVLTLFPTGDD